MLARTFKVLLSKNKITTETTVGMHTNENRLQLFPIGSMLSDIGNIEQLTPSTHSNDDKMMIAIDTKTVNIQKILTPFFI